MTTDDLQVGSDSTQTAGCHQYGPYGFGVFASNSDESTGVSFFAHNFKSNKTLAFCCFYLDGFRGLDKHSGHGFKKNGQFSKTLTVIVLSIRLFHSDFSVGFVSGFGY